MGCAGDDLVLADYTATIGPVKTKLHDILEKLSEGLVGLSSSEYGDVKITFGAGISERKGSISCTMEDSWKKEKNAKEIWKQEMRDKNPRMIQTLMERPKKSLKSNCLKIAK